MTSWRCGPCQLFSLLLCSRDEKLHRNHIHVCMIKLSGISQMSALSRICRWCIFRGKLAFFNIVCESLLHTPCCFPQCYSFRALILNTLFENFRALQISDCERIKVIFPQTNERKEKQTGKSDRSQCNL